MMERPAPAHCARETLLDLAEGLPVDAAARAHLAGCGECSRRVSELKQTLSTVAQVAGEEPGAEYWASFALRLRERIGGEETPRTARAPRWLWAVAAAAAVALFLRAALDWWSGPGSIGPAASAESLLPPAEEDAEFQFLVAMAETIEPEQDLEDLAADWDLSWLSAEEQAELVEKLRSALQEIGHAKS
jgi:hypothetical protein